jgi:inosose dehydratase
MINVAEELAVQSYCFRAFKDNARVAELVKQCGLSRIEVCAVHLDMKNPDSFEGVVGAYRDAGVEIPCIGVWSFGADEAVARNYFKFAKLSGARCIAVDFSTGDLPDNFRMAQRLSEEHGIPVAIHNHGGRHWLGPAQILQEIFKRTGPGIGLCLDTAWALDSGEDPVRMAKRFADRLRMVHLKDFTFDRAGKPEDVVVGTGNLDLPAFFGLLREQDFDGCATLEYEGDVEDPVPALRKCVEAIKQVWQQG